jgi:hypothetical protein
MALMPGHGSRLREAASLRARDKGRTVQLGTCERRHPDSNRGVEVLQTSALPLGYAARCQMICGGKVRIIIARVCHECKGFLRG